MLVATSKFPVLTGVTTFHKKATNSLQLSLCLWCDVWLLGNWLHRLHARLWHAVMYSSTPQEVQHLCRYRLWPACAIMETSKLSVFMLYLSLLHYMGIMQKYFFYQCFINKLFTHYFTYMSVLHLYFFKYIFYFF